MRSLKILKYILFSFVFLILFSFLAIITSNKITNEIFIYLSKEFPIKYKNVEGNLYSGITIKELNYDDMINIDRSFISLSFLPLLLKEIYISELNLEKITFSDKFFSFIKENQNNKEEAENKEELNFFMNIFIKKLDLTIFDFEYEDKKIDEFIFSAKNIKSDLKNKHSLDYLLNIKSNMANIYLDGNLKDDNYKINSKIDLKEYVQSVFLLDLEGNFRKIDFILKNENLKIKEDENLKVKNTILEGFFDIEKQNLDIFSLKSEINYKQIASILNAKINLKNLDINSINFEANLQTEIQKTIWENINKDIFINSNISGNNKEIKIDTKISKNSINIDKNNLIFENAILNAIAKLDNKNLDVKADLNFDTNFANQKSKIDFKVNLDDFKSINLKAKTIIEGLKYEDYNLKPIGNLVVNSSYNSNSFDIDLNSKYIDMFLKSKEFKRFDFDLKLKDINPNNFYKLNDFIKISKIDGKIKGYYDNSLYFNSNLILNNNFNLDSSFKLNDKNIESNLKNNTFFIEVVKNGDKINLKSKIKELNNFENELVKILKYDKLNLKGLIDAEFDIENNNIDFEIKSPKISFENESLDKLYIKANLKNNILYFDKLEFFIGKIYDINLQKNFILKNDAFLDLNTFNGNFDYENISLKILKDEENNIIKVTTKELFLEHNLYGSSFIDSNLDVNIKKDSKISLNGELNLNKLKATYNIPALNISKDKDIIILKNSDKNSDFFLENISMELLIFSNEAKYSVKNIDLKSNILLNIKKEFNKNLRIYGSVSNIAGSFYELGKNYDIKDSNVYFRGLDPIDPILDIKANTKVDDILISIFIGGSLDNPRLNLSSSPIMNQKDILSYLIFGTNFSSSTKSNQSRQSQASLFLLNELSKDYAKELGVDSIYFQYDPTTQYIETHVGKNIGEKNKVVLKNKAYAGQLVFMRELTKLWNLELGFEEKTQSIDLIYKKRY